VVPRKELQQPGR
jgi:protein required for attachment to host cells